MILLIVYLVGVIISYLLFRYDFRKTFNNWTIGDRNLIIFLSVIGSWAAVIAGIASLLSNISNKKPAKW